MRALRVIPVVVLAMAGVLASASVASASPVTNGPGGGNYNCTGASGGVIPPGTYNSMIITGVCYMSAGNVVVRGNVTVAPGALLDAVSSGDPAASPAVPATVDIGGNVFVGSGAVLLFGCSPNITCTDPPAITYDRIGGNLTAINALGVVLHSASVGGSINVIGGGGGAAAENCSAVTEPPSTPVPPAPWSEDADLLFTPVYTDFEDVTIGGNLSVSGLTSCWLGSLRNQIGGSATYIGNSLGDPDAMEIANNLIGGNMICAANTEGGTPGVQFGDAGAAPNIVGGIGVGQCGFNVVVLNPPAEALAQDTPPETCTPALCIPEHIAVSKWGFGTYYGSHVQVGPSVQTLSIGVTESGDTLAAAVNNVVLHGSGLTGTITANPALPLGQSGEAVSSTTYPNGSESFTAFDNCDCTFHGQTGMITIRAYGTTSPNGSTWGTFLVTSGGAGAGGLSTLAGYGTFSSAGQRAGSLGLVEHLKIT